MPNINIFTDELRRPPMGLITTVMMMKTKNMMKKTEFRTMLNVRLRRTEFHILLRICQFVQLDIDMKYDKNCIKDKIKVEINISTF